MAEDEKKKWQLLQHDITAEQLKKIESVGSVAIDSETLGLEVTKDRLCLLQLSIGDGQAWLVQFFENQYQAPNLVSLLTNPKILKIFHYARFDMAVLYYYLKAMPEPIYCTKLVSRIVRPQAESHSLFYLTKDLLGIALSKEQQQSNWGDAELSQEQLAYAANDVLYLHQLKEKLDNIMASDDRTIIEACAQFLKTRVLLDLRGFDGVDIFAHH